jgi:hypothetical protein
MPAAHFVGDDCPPDGHKAEWEEGIAQPWTGQSPKPKPEPTYMLDSVNFMDGGIAISYMNEKDQRVKGSLIQTHSLAIQDNEQFERLIEGVRTSVLALLRDALEDFDAADADAPDEGPEDDDDD